MKVIRHDSSYVLMTRAGQATVTNLVPYEERETNKVVRWDCRLTLSSGGVTLFEDFRVIPEPPFKPLAQLTKLDIHHVLEKLANSPEVQQYVGRFETVHAQMPNTGFLVSNLPD